MEYLKVAEVQRRGLVHFHAIVRVDTSHPAGEFEAGALIRAVRQAIRKTSVHSNEEQFEFGVIHDVQDLGASAQDVRSAATYISKYVTKTASDSIEVARRFKSRRQIRNALLDPLPKRLALTAWDLGLERYANTLGYRGQFLTKSRGYSTTFGSLRQARANYWNGLRDADPTIGSFRYDGRGYDDPRAGELADVLATLERERRLDMARKAKTHRSDDSCAVSGIGDEQSP